MKVTAIITNFNEGKTGYRQTEKDDKKFSQADNFQYVDELSEKNKGNELRATVQSLRENTSCPLEIVVIDDGSTDNSADGLHSEGVTVISHKQRIGIAVSRHEGVLASASDSDCVAFFDAHQRVSPRCVDACAELACEKMAIVWPDVYGIQKRDWTGHGAFATTHPKDKENKRYFGATWNRKAPRDPISRISAMVVPGYVMPKSVYDQIQYNPVLREWGASEPALWVKAFFLDIDILHLCGHTARHLFRPHAPHYKISWNSIYRNQATVAKECFDPDTWDRYWFPTIFDNKHLDEQARKDLDSPLFLSYRDDFQSRKKRPDVEFWRGLCLEDCPCEELVCA